MNQLGSVTQAPGQTTALRYLATATVAARLSITARSVRLWAECGEIPGVKFGRQWRFEQRAFEEWLAARTEASPAGLQNGRLVSSRRRA
jgi:excisionase family DNA binding protein